VFQQAGQHLVDDGADELVLGGVVAASDVAEHGQEQAARATSAATCTPWTRSRSTWAHSASRSRSGAADCARDGVASRVMTVDLSMVAAPDECSTKRLTWTWA